MALYHTYRPQTFDDVLGQPHIIGVLKSALSHDRIGHAYLFSGPRGVGKTSIARILAKAINCELQTANGKQQTAGNPIPCNSCQACTSITDGSALDVIEIDAASNRGIDEIRELRDRVRFAPTQMAKKVYIIDEVHMLTKEAFNALLKTLEEPPDHAVFVLATTELNKIPETIFSRCQHFQFRRAAPEALSGHLQKILAEEQRTIDPDALDLVVLRAEGSYRDALSAVEQVLMANDAPAITADTVRSLFGLPAESTALDLLAGIAVGDREAILGTLEALSAQGISLESFTGELIRIVRLLLFVSTLGAERMSGGSEAFRTAAPALLRSLSAGQLVELLKTLTRASADARTSPIPTLPLELALLGFGQLTEPMQYVRANSPARPAVKAAPVSAAVSAADVKIVNERSVEKDSLVELERTADVNKKEIDKESTNEEEKTIETGEKNSASQDQKEAVPSAVAVITSTITPDQWHALRRAIKSADSALGMLVAELDVPVVTDDTVTLTVPFKFHADQLQSKKATLTLPKVFGEALGRPVRVLCMVAPTNRRPKRSESAGIVLEDPVGALSEL